MKQTLTFKFSKEFFDDNGNPLPEAYKEDMIDFVRSKGGGLRVTEYDDKKNIYRGILTPIWKNIDEK